MTISSMMYMQFSLGTTPKYVMIFSFREISDPSEGSVFLSYGLPLIGWQVPIPKYLDWVSGFANDLVS